MLFEKLHVKQPMANETSEALGRAALLEDQSPTTTSLIDDPRIASLPSEERSRAAKDTLELYEVAREYVAPVIAGFADYLLTESEDRQIVFAARDGIGSLKVARILKQKFEYESEESGQLVYAYTNRRVVYGTEQGTLATHLKQAGVRDLGASALLADIGVYGSIVPTLRGVMPNIEPHFLISKNQEIPGYAHTIDKPLSAFKTTSGNPAVHFSEDTFSGPIASPSSLIEENGWLIPDTLRSTYPPVIALKRQYALAALADYTRSLTEPPEQPATSAITKWNEFLEDKENYAHLMVPHES